MEYKFHYVTNYSLDLCLEYMKHDNIYDKFEYVWEERENYYIITFKEYKSSMLSLANAPKPTFKVIFENMGNQTGILVQFIKGFLQPSPSVYTKDIDTFWEKKLDAKSVGEVDGGIMVKERDSFNFCVNSKSDIRYVDSYLRAETGYAAFRPYLHYTAFLRHVNKTYLKTLFTGS